MIVSINVDVLKMSTGNKGVDKCQLLGETSLRRPSMSSRDLSPDFLKAVVVPNSYDFGGITLLRRRRS